MSPKCSRSLRSTRWCLTRSTPPSIASRSTFAFWLRKPAASLFSSGPRQTIPRTSCKPLDGGADGVVIPHIRSAEEAEKAALACRYRPGGRGYAGSTRAARYTTLGMAAHREAAENVAVIAQIEDAEALEEIDAIARVAGIDALFIGRADLTVSLNAPAPDDPKVVNAVERICAAGMAAGMSVGMFLSHEKDVGMWRARGASLFILRSDQEFLLAGAKSLSSAIRG